MPRSWTHSLWISETSVAGTLYGQKTRSPLLVAVDQALRSYEFATAQHKLKALHQLFDAFDAWRASKNAEGADSIRNKGGELLNDFKEWLGAQETALMPQKEAGWNGTPNCYAYAMKCKQIAGNAPTPGAAAGKTVSPFDPKWRAAAQKIRYHAMLFQGIVDDANACGKHVEILRGPAEGSYPSPLNPPVERADGSHYIAAMVVKTDGFHFMRRDSKTGLWSHKNGGADAEVETSATLLPTPGQLGPREIPLTDPVAVELLQCTQGKYVAFAGFRFAGYVLVPHDGITVAGAF